MEIPLLEPRRVKFTTGYQIADLQHLAFSHPFTQQLDVVFPSNDALEAALCQLEARYVEAKVVLSTLIDAAGDSVNPLGFESDLLALSSDEEDDDVWCIDHRGLLTLSVSKDTYERLGLLGKKLTFGKELDERYVIHLPLQKNAESVANRARRDAALKAWEGRREAAGSKPWNALYCFENPDALTQFATKAGQEDMVREVKCQKFTSTDVHVPVVKLRPQPKKDKKGTGTVEDEAEDWTAAVAALLEWVGMACLGSQRLQINDNVDPYIALYEPPSTSRTAGVTHLRWRGFLGPQFVQKLINAAITTTVPSANSSLDALSSPQFLSITSHGCPWSPVSYISPSTLTPTTGKATNLQTPLRYPRKTAEDTWSLVLVPDALAESAGGNQADAGWIMAESIGKWDAR